MPEASILQGCELPDARRDEQCRGKHGAGTYHYAGQEAASFQAPLGASGNGTEGRPHDHVAERKHARRHVRCTLLLTHHAGEQQQQGYRARQHHAEHHDPPHEEDDYGVPDCPCAGGHQAVGGRASRRHLLHAGLGRVAHAHRLGHLGHLEGAHAHTSAGKYVGPTQYDHCDQCDHHHEAIAPEHGLQIKGGCHQNWCPSWRAGSGGGTHRGPGSGRSDPTPRRTTSYAGR